MPIQLDQSLLVDFIHQATSMRSLETQKEKAKVKLKQMQTKEKNYCYKTGLAPRFTDDVMSAFIRDFINRAQDVFELTAAMRFIVFDGNIPDSFLAVKERAEFLKQDLLQ